MHDGIGDMVHPPWQVPPPIRQVLRLFPLRTQQKLSSELSKIVTILKIQLFCLCVLGK